METLQTSHGTFTVYVNALNSHEGKQFHISFIDKQNKLHVILMNKQDDRWVLAEPENHPDWVVELRNQFDYLIVREQLRTHTSLALAS